MNREYKPVVKIKVYFQGKIYYVAVVYASVKICLIFTPKRDWKFRGTPEIKSMWIKHSDKFQGGGQSDENHVHSGSVYWTADFNQIRGGGGTTPPNFLFPSLNPNFKSFLTCLN